MEALSYNGKNVWLVQVLKTVRRNAEFVALLRRAGAPSQNKRDVLLAWPLRADAIRHNASDVFCVPTRTSAQRRAGGVVRDCRGQSPKALWNAQRKSEGILATHCYFKNELRFRMVVDVPKRL